MNTKKTFLLLGLISIALVVTFCSGNKRKDTYKKDKITIEDKEDADGYVKIKNNNPKQLEGIKKVYSKVKQVEIDSEAIDNLEGGMVATLDIDGTLNTYHIEGDKVTVYQGKRRMVGTGLKWDGWERVLPYPTKAIKIDKLKEK